MATLFEKIIAGEIPAEKVFENASIIVIKDIAPKAPVHLLLIPKKAIPDLQSLLPEDMPYITELFAALPKIAEQFHLAKNGYRLLVNNGLHAGQEIPHLHFHLLGGKALGPLIAAC